MDIRAISQLTGASSSAAAVVVPVDTRALISDVAASTALSHNEKSGLIAAAAAVDSGLTGSVRTSVLEQIQRLGIYLRNSANDGFPRWEMMTALRAYGMNLSSDAGASQATVLNSVKGQLQQIAQQSRSVSLETAVAAAPVPVPPPVARVEVRVETPAADTGTRVEKIV